MLGPFLGARIMSATGSPRSTCLLAASVSALTALYIAFGFEETLEKGKKKPIDWAACNPFSFLNFFKESASRSLRMLSALTILQSVPSDMHDVKMVMLKTKLGLTPKGIGKCKLLYFYIM